MARRCSGRSHDADPGWPFVCASHNTGYESHFAVHSHSTGLSRVDQRTDLLLLLQQHFLGEIILLNWVILLNTVQLKTNFL